MTVDGVAPRHWGDRIGEVRGDPLALDRILKTLLRVFLPAAFIVLAVYVVFIPFRFMEPFRNREELITYTIMSFAVVGLLLGVSPHCAGSIGAKQGRWLRGGIIGVAALALLVSAYAFAAILTRTIQYGITPNRLAFTGWLLVNAAILALLLLRQGWRARPEEWPEELHVTFGTASVWYIGWSAIVVLAVPLLFLR